MKAAIYSFIQKHSLIKPNDCVLVGLSGGPDSVFLLHMLHELKADLGITLVAAYLDHGWRADTHEDIALCQRLCQSLDISFESAHVHDLDFIPKEKGSLEDTARAYRRFYFTQLAQKYGTNTVALGHHQDDQLETFLIRLTRGASLSGLGAMRPRSGLFIRPLLATPKKAILDYLKQHSIPYRLDTTNDSDKFLRNRLRKHAIPALEQCDTRARSNAIRSVEHLQEAHEAIMITLEEKKVAIFSRCNYNKISIQVAHFQNELSFFQKELVAGWLIDANVSIAITEALINEIIRFLCSPRGGVHQLHEKWSIIKKNNKAFIETK